MKPNVVLPNHRQRHGPGWAVVLWSRSGHHYFAKFTEGSTQTVSKAPRKEARKNPLAQSERAVELILSAAEQPARTREPRQIDPKCTLVWHMLGPTFSQPLSCLLRNATVSVLGSEGFKFPLEDLLFSAADLAQYLTPIGQKAYSTLISQPEL